jgi:HD superfamily phosphodiesterase
MLYFPKFDNGISKTMASVMLEPNDPVHGVDHTREVFNTCMNILHSRIDDNGRLYVDFNVPEGGKGKPIRLHVTQRIINIMVIAAAFHDVCRGKDNHEIEGAELFESYFSDISETVPGKKSIFTIIENDLIYKIILDREDVEVVKCIIRSHRSSNGQALHLINEPDMLCAILRDADKLDAIVLLPVVIKLPGPSTIPLILELTDPEPIII